MTKVRADGYGFQIEMAYWVAELGGRISEVPISFTDRTEGMSKMSSAIVVEALGLVTWWGIRDRVKRLLGQPTLRPSPSQWWRGAHRAGAADVLSGDSEPRLER
jgi:dolichol-phosphate mannosyltransferase